jgi:hypothetical protein
MQVINTLTIKCTIDQNQSQKFLRICELTFFAGSLQTNGKEADVKAEPKNGAKERRESSVFPAKSRRERKKRFFFFSALFFLLSPPRSVSPSTASRVSRS